MATTANFASLLDRRADDIEKPKPLPMGTYTWRVKSHLFDESSQKKTPFIRFMVSPMSPSADVDTEALAEVKEWQNKEMRLDFYLTDDAMWRLKDFLGHCGISLDGRTLGEAIPDTVNAVFNGYVKHEMAQNGTDVFAKIDGTSIAE